MEVKKVFGSNVLVKLHKQSSTLKSGIQVPGGESVIVVNIGEVIDKGTDCKDNSIKIGTKVVLSQVKPHLTRLNIAGSPHALIPEDQIIASVDYSDADFMDMLKNKKMIETIN